MSELKRGQVQGKPVMNYQSYHHGTYSLSKTAGVRDVKMLRFHELCKATADSFACLRPLSWFHELCKATADSFACLRSLSWFHELCKATADSYACLRPLSSFHQLCKATAGFCYACLRPLSWFHELCHATSGFCICMFVPAVLVSSTVQGHAPFLYISMFASTVLP